MSPKSIVMIFFVIGSFIGSYAPALFGISIFSYTSVFLGAIGGIIGIFIGYKISQNI
jgi:hypothetical protein